MLNGEWAWVTLVILSAVLVLALGPEVWHRRSGLVAASPTAPPVRREQKRPRLSLFPDTHGRTAILGVLNNGPQDRFRVRVKELIGTNADARPCFAPRRTAMEMGESFLLGLGAMDYVNIAAPTDLAISRWPEMITQGSQRQHFLTLFSTTEPQKGFERILLRGQRVEMEIAVYAEEPSTAVCDRFLLWFDDASHMHFDRADERGNRATP